MNKLRRHCILSLAVFAAMAASPLLQAQPAPVLEGIEEVQLGVSELARSQAFYTALFGTAPGSTPDSDSVILQLGESRLVLQPAAQPGVLQHSLALASPAPGQLRDYLGLQGIRWQDAADGSVLVRDGDAVETRLGPVTARQSSASDATGRAVFNALLIDEISVTVTNMQVDSMFYARLLGQTSTAVAGSQFFRIGQHARLRLGQAAVGQASGFNYFSVLVVNTDMEAAAEAVFRAGGIVETFLPNGFSFWDPDGLRVIVRSVPQVINGPAAGP